jgi:hypothetical protein
MREISLQRKMKLMVIGIIFVTGLVLLIAFGQMSVNKIKKSPTAQSLQIRRLPNINYHKLEVLK